MTITDDAWEAKAYDEYIKRHPDEECNPRLREQLAKDEWNKTRMEESMTTETKTALTKYQNSTSLTQADAMMILQTIFPGADESEMVKAAMLCHDYQLNPLKKHVSLIRFKNSKAGKDDWVAVMSIDVERLLASRRGRYLYIDDTPRVMSEAEQMKRFGSVDKDKIWAITKLSDTKGGGSVGYGFWPKSQTPYGTEKGNTAMNMAFIRSERQALRRLFPAEMPNVNVEVFDETVIPEVKYRDITNDTKELPPLGSTSTPDAQEIADLAPESSEQVAEVTPVKSTAFPKLFAKYGDMLLVCWEHNAEWHDGKYDKSHKEGNDWCNWKNQIKRIAEELCLAAGVDAGTLNDTCKERYNGRTWSKLQPEEHLTMLEGLMPATAADAKKE